MPSFALIEYTQTYQSQDIQHLIGEFAKFIYFAKIPLITRIIPAKALKSLITFFDWHLNTEAIETVPK